MKVAQTQHAHALIRSLQALDARTQEIERSVDPAALVWMPPNGGWSVGQVFEHLYVANDDYLDEIRPLLARLGPAGAASADVTWKSSFVGGMLAKSMVSPRKLPAPKAWKPGPEPRAGVIREFLALQRDIVQLIERSTSHDWKRLRLASPVSALIRMNIGDAFTILVRHEERHFAQIDERLAAFEATRGDRVAVAR